jgi:uncharacterized membrane protein HdeD (DUF308 family)
MPCSVEIALLTVGAVFLLLGVIGRVEAFNVKGGTDNKTARLFLGILGFVLLYLAVGQWYAEKLQQNLDRERETFNEIMQGARR